MKVSKEEMCIKSIELFKEKGYSNVSVSDICMMFDVTRGSFYHHFEDKGDLLLYWQKIQSEKNALNPTIEPTNDSLFNLRLFNKQYAEMISSLGYELLYETMIATGKKENGSFVIEGSFTLLKASMEQFLALIEKAQKDEKITKNISPSVLAKHYTLALTGLSFDWYEARGGFDFVEEAGSIFNTIFR